MHKLQAGLLAVGLLFGSVAPLAAQQDRRDSRGNYYNGMHQQVRKGDYNRYNQQDEQRHHHDDRNSGGGIGPGKAALIGGAGGAALGALFGGGLKGTIIGGAAGAGIGAIGGKLAQGNDHRDDHHR